MLAGRGSSLAVFATVEYSLFLSLYYGVSYLFIIHNDHSVALIFVHQLKTPGSSC